MTEGRKLEQTRSSTHLVMWSKQRTSFAPVCVPPSPRSAPRPREVDLRGSERGSSGRLPSEERRRLPWSMPVRCKDTSSGTGGGGWTSSWRGTSSRTNVASLTRGSISPSFFIDGYEVTFWVMTKKIPKSFFAVSGFLMPRNTQKRNKNNFEKINKK